MRLFCTALLACVMAGLAAAEPPRLATEYRCAYVWTLGQRTATGTLTVTPSGYRYERGLELALIIHAGQRSGLRLRVQERTAVEVSAGEKPCQYLVPTFIPGLAWKLLGQEQIGAVACDRYEVTLAAPEMSFLAWIDPARGVMLRHQSNQGRYDFAEFAIGPIDASLLAMPADYRLSTPAEIAGRQQSTPGVTFPSEAELQQFRADLVAQGVWDPDALRVGMDARINAWLAARGVQKATTPAAPPAAQVQQAVATVSRLIDGIAPQDTTPTWATAHGRDHHGYWATAHLAGQEVRFRLIPAGTFRMGDPVPRSDHQVTLTRPFWLAETPVTSGLWKAVMGADPSRRATSPRHPVEHVSWEDCQAFIAKLRADGRMHLALQSEAQWEFACRAGTDGPVAGDLDATAWHGINSGGTTHPVGTKEPNGFGLFDMNGNVWQWCADDYAPGYGCPPGRVPATIDPIGPEHPDPRGRNLHVLRGIDCLTPPEATSSMRLGESGIGGPMVIRGCRLAVVAPETTVRPADF